MKSVLASSKNFIWDKECNYFGISGFLYKQKHGGTEGELDVSQLLTSHESFSLVDIEVTGY